MHPLETLAIVWMVLGIACAIAVAANTRYRGIRLVAISLLAALFGPITLCVLLIGAAEP